MKGNQKWRGELNFVFIYKELDKIGEMNRSDWKKLMKTV